MTTTLVFGRIGVGRRRHITRHVVAPLPSAGPRGTSRRRSRVLAGVQGRAWSTAGLGPRLRGRRRSGAHFIGINAHFLSLHVGYHACEGEYEPRRSRKPSGRRREVRSRRRSEGLETEEEGILHTRPAEVQVQGLRRSLGVRARAEEEAMQGVRRGRDLPPRSSAFAVQRVRWCIHLRARSSAQ